MNPDVAVALDAEMDQTAAHLRDLASVARLNLSDPSMRTLVRLIHGSVIVGLGDGSAREQLLRARWLLSAWAELVDP